VKLTLSTRILAIVAAALLLIGIGAMAQAQAPAAEPAGPTLTELERAKAELLQVRTAYAQLLAQHDACKAEVGSAFNTLGALRARAASEQLTTEETALKVSVEAGHPGWSWDAKTGLFTKKPDVAKAPGK
jgi:hypothetical protein